MKVFKTFLLNISTKEDSTKTKIGSTGRTTADFQTGNI